MQKCAILSLFFTAPVFSNLKEAQPVELHSTDASAISGALSVSWESRYVSEGRDNLDGDALWTTALEAGWENLSAGLWFAKSYDQDYDEFNFDVALSKSFDELEVYLAYTRLEFPFDGSHDDEVGAGLLWSGLPLEIELAVDVYYSFEADGCFAEFTVARTVELSEFVHICIVSEDVTNFKLARNGSKGSQLFICLNLKNLN
jgi:hypothetical protein|tara:strand:- start:1292 stop:1897 length:606 start_codon:yes stop_codon:yes gene_type:complete